MARGKLTLEQQIANAKKKLAALEAKAKSGNFESVIAKHRQTITTIYADLKTASGKQRGMDVDILTAVAEAMGMKGMTITKRCSSVSQSSLTLSLADCCIAHLQCRFKTTVSNWLGIRLVLSPPQSS